MPDTTEASAVPSLSERIRELLPDHTHGDGDRVVWNWSWSTRDAVWNVKICGGGATRQWVGLTAEPDGRWTFTGTPDTILRRLAGVLKALDAIGGGTDA